MGNLGACERAQTKFRRAGNFVWMKTCIDTIKTQLKYIYIYTSGTRLLGRFVTCLAQTTTASRLLFALGWHFMPRKCQFFLEIFEFKFLINFVQL